MKSELEAMFDTDQAHRMEMERVGQEHGFDSPEMKELWKKQRPIDETNIAGLVEIIEMHGWPGRTLAGERDQWRRFWSFSMPITPIKRNIFHS